jgi:uncharacterized protein (TIGR02246 family)
VNPSTTEAGQEQRAAELTLLQDTIHQFTEAFNRFDAAEVAKFWAEDGTLISPVGAFGEGRDGVERVFQTDAATILEGSSSTFLITRVRRIGGDLAFLDLDHDVRNCRMPDGSRGNMKIHLVLLARKDGDHWRWLDARPYRFVDRPPSLH